MRRGFDDVPGSLPTNRIPQDFDLKTIPFPDLAENVLSNLCGSAVDEDALWRDHLSMTGQIRTFSGAERIKEKWALCCREKLPGVFKAGEARLSRPTPNSSWIDVPFTFVTKQEGGLTGNCSGAISLVPSQEGTGWRVWMLRTLLENFEGYGHPDDPSPIFQQPKAAATLGCHLEASVLIIGAGQSGLSLAGRLGALSIPYLLLEKEAEIGYSWTGKYDSVRQHTIREMNNLPFDRTYKASDPDLLPAKTVAEGFENYVRKYNINIWLAAEVKKCVASREGDWVDSQCPQGKRRVCNKDETSCSLYGCKSFCPKSSKDPKCDIFQRNYPGYWDIQKQHTVEREKGCCGGVRNRSP
jgi:hypothetical protein